MSKTLTGKSRNLTLAALVLFFFMFNVFCKVELAAANLIDFIIESVFFVFIYALTLFNIPLLVPLLLLVAGCVGKGFMYASAAGAEKEDFLFPATYFFAFLFYIEQLYYIRGKGDSLLVKALSWASRLLPLGLLAAVIVISLDGFENKIKFYYLYIFNIVITVLVALVYLVIAFHPEKKEKSKKKKKNAQDSFDRGPLSASFALVFIPLFTSCLLFILGRAHATCLMHVLPLLYILNLILLYWNGHPLINSFVERIREKTASDDLS